MRAIHAAISRGLLRSCHDLSEGGLAVALAEMAFAGGLGALVALVDIPCEDDASSDLVRLFSESPSRFLVEARLECLGELVELWSGVPFCRLGEVTGPASGDSSAFRPRMTVRGRGGSTVLDAATAHLKNAWQEPLNW
jgi:phosphoribosylformylglycinamidine (FGAM) synthase-like enzyme